MADVEIRALTGRVNTLRASADIYTREPAEIDSITKRLIRRAVIPLMAVRQLNDLSSFDEKGESISELAKVVNDLFKNDSLASLQRDIKDALTEPYIANVNTVEWKEYGAKVLGEINSAIEITGIKSADVAGGTNAINNQLKQLNVESEQLQKNSRSRFQQLERLTK